jgi:hypothetical protein
MAQPRKIKTQTGELVDEGNKPGPGPGELGEQPMPEFPPDIHRIPAPGGPGDIGEAPAPDINPGRGRETPRERGGGGVAPRRPSEPDPMAGSSFQSGMGGPGVLPFQPMPGPQGGMAQGGLFGSMGGLKGGGLGVPLDPTSNAASDPIDTLIQLLMRGR